MTSHLGIPAKTLGLISLLALIAGLLVYVALLPAKSVQNTNNTTEKKEQKLVADTTLSIEPSKKSTLRNRVYNVSIQTGKNKVTAVQLELAFDPAVLYNVEISASRFFPDYLELLNSIDTKNGRISYALTIPPEEEAVKGTGTLAQITFNIASTSAFPTFIKFMPKTEVSAENTDKSVLKETVDATIYYLTPTTTPTP